MIQQPVCLMWGKKYYVCNLKGFKIYRTADMRGNKYTLRCIVMCYGLNWRWHTVIIDQEMWSLGSDVFIIVFLKC